MYSPCPRSSPGSAGSKTAATVCQHLLRMKSDQTVCRNARNSSSMGSLRSPSYLVNGTSGPEHPQSYPPVTAPASHIKSRLILVPARLRLSTAPLKLVALLFHR